MWQRSASFHFYPHIQQQFAAGVKPPHVCLFLQIIPANPKRGSRFKQPPCNGLSQTTQTTCFCLELVFDSGCFLFPISSGDLAEWALLGVHSGSVAPLRALPTTLRSVCIHSVPKHSCHGLDNPHNEETHWFKKAGGSWSVCWTLTFFSSFPCSPRPSSSCRGGILAPTIRKLLTCVTQTTSVTKRTVI